MPAFGSSDAQKEAQGYAREKGNWDFGQYKDWLDKSQAQNNQGNALTQWNVDNNFNRAQTGFASPDKINQKGAEIMPGLEDMIARKQGRLNDIGASFSNLTPASTTVGDINRNIDTAGQQIGSNYDAIQGDINGTYGAAADREAAGHQASVDDLKNRYGALTGNVDTAYGDLRGTNAKTYNDLGTENAQSAAEQQKNAELLNPASQFGRAQVAQSYAPEISNTLQRLRRSGVDPNSVQAVGALNSVERDRARGMDDAAAKGTGTYVDAINKLKSTQLNNDIGLGTSKLNNEIGLGTQQVGKTTDLGREQGNAYRDEVTRDVGAQNSLDLSKLGNSVQNRDTAFTRGQDYYKQKNDATMLNRNLQQQDWTTASNLNREQNANEDQNAQLRDTQYQRGLQWNANDMAERNSAAAAIGAQGNQDTANAIQEANAARGFGNDASNNYSTSYGYEAPNANWGTKLIAGAAGAALDAFAPGSGSFLTGMAGGGAGGGVAARPGTQGSGGMGSPSSWWSQPTAQYNLDAPKWGSSTPLYSGQAYDPTKTKPLSDGSLQVGKY